MTLREASIILGIKERTARAWIASGRLKGTKREGSRFWEFDMDSIAAANKSGGRKDENKH